jgi:2-dehydropantoate 2-reductase
MRILVYGAGPLGSLYAVKLKQAGNDVSILARGKRLAAIRENGISLKDGATGARETVDIDAVEALGPDDSYDLIMVIMAKHHLGEVLPVLAANSASPLFLFMCNNAAGPGMMTEALGSERVLLGFAGAAGFHKDGILEYVVVSRREQPTTIGELDGRSTERLKKIRDMLEGAGFPAAISSNMDAWLKTHVAEVAPTAAALYMAGGDLQKMAGSDRILELMVRAIRENYALLKSAGIPIMPGSHAMFKWIPLSMLKGIMRKMLQDDTMEYKIGHAMASGLEWRLLTEELRALAKSEIRTPAMDELYGYLVEPADD